MYRSIDFLARQRAIFPFLNLMRRFFRLLFPVSRGVRRWIGLAVLAASPLPLHAVPDGQVEELLVVASKVPSERQTTGAAVSVLTREDMIALGQPYVADVLRQVPGVTVTRTGGYGGFTQLRMRGAEANHTLILIDGVEVAGAGTGEFDFASLLAADVERIEVVRGAQSGLYGSNALAGVIDIRTRDVDDASVRVALEAGADAARHAAVSASGRLGPLAGRLSYTRRTTEFDLSVNDSVAPADDDQDRNESLSGRLVWEVGEALRLDLYGRLADRKTDTDGFDFSGGPQQGLAVDDLSRVDGEDVSVGAMLTLTQRDERSVTRLRIEDTDTQTQGGTFGNESDRRQYKFDTSWQWNDTHRSTIFVEREEERFRNLVPFEPSQVPAQQRDSTGYGVEHRWRIGGRAYLNAALRQDDNQDFKDAFTYALNGSVEINASTSIHAGFGRAITNPTFFEQFGFTPSLFVGNPDLKPESSLGWDVGITHRVHNVLRADVTYFRADLQDEIISVFPTAENAGVASDREGVEVGIHLYPSEAWSIRGAYTYTDATQDGEREVLRPRHSAALDVRWQPAARWQVDVGAVYNGAVLDNDFRNFFSNGFQAARARLDRFVLVNVQVRHRLTPALHAHARIANLFDERYQQVLSYAAPGRAAFAGLTLDL